VGDGALVGFSSAHLLEADIAPYFGLNSIAHCRAVAAGYRQSHFFSGSSPVVVVLDGIITGCMGG